MLIILNRFRKKFCYRDSECIKTLILLPLRALRDESGSLSEPQKKANSLVTARLYYTM